MKASVILDRTSDGVADLLRGPGGRRDAARIPVTWDRLGPIGSGPGIGMATRGPAAFGPEGPGPVLPHRAATPYMRDLQWIWRFLAGSKRRQRIVFLEGAAQVGRDRGGWQNKTDRPSAGFHQGRRGAMLGRSSDRWVNWRKTQFHGQGGIDPLPMRRRALNCRQLRVEASPLAADAGNTMLSKEFAGGILIMTGANSAVGLRSTPARYIFLDEVDAYPGSADEEGDPVTLAEARSLTFAHRRKVFLVSTPTIRGLSRIEREYEASDQRRFFVPCPHCGHEQWLKFERLRWDKGRPETAAYTCEGCDGAIAEHHKTAMLARISHEGRCIGV